MSTRRRKTRKKHTGGDPDDSAKEGICSTTTTSEPLLVQDTVNTTANQQEESFSETDIDALLHQMDAARSEVQSLLTEASRIAKRIGVDTHSDLAKSFERGAIGISSTTAGYSNTDHIIELTGNHKCDRISSLKRMWLARKRREKPENLGTERWSKPKIAGSRRRRIERASDAPEAPVEPTSLTGYTVFVGQCTIKHRHDHPNEAHDQSRLMLKLSNQWKLLSNEEQDHYRTIAENVIEEYGVQLLEYQATGRFTPSDRFENLKGKSIWIPKNPEERNALEKEISEYETVNFRPRPQELDEAYQKREVLSKRRRSLKAKGHSDEDIEELLDKEFPDRGQYEKPRKRKRKS